MSPPLDLRAQRRPHFPSLPIPQGMFQGFSCFTGFGPLSLLFSKGLRRKDPAGAVKSPDFAVASPDPAVKDPDFAAGGDPRVRSSTASAAPACAHAQPLFPKESRNRAPADAFRHARARRADVAGRTGPRRVHSPRSDASAFAAISRAGDVRADCALAPGARDAGKRRGTAPFGAPRPDGVPGADCGTTPRGRFAVRAADL